MIVLSIKDFLLGNGLFVYRDWTWPLSNDLTPVSNFSPSIIRNSGVDPLGFVRIFVTWPIAVIDHLTANPTIAEKAYVLYFFSIFAILFFILAECLLQTLDTIRGRIVGLANRELYVLTVVFFCFVNLWSLEQLSDLYFTYVIEFALITISVALAISEASWVRTALVPGALLALCVFLDPDLYPYGLLSIAAVTLFGSIVRSRSFRDLPKALGRIAAVVIVTLPALATMIFTFDISTGTNLRPLYSFQASTGNLSLTNAIRLMGYWWSTIAYSPPSIVTTSGPSSQLNSLGSPTYMLLPSGSLTFLWLATTWVTPVLAIGVAIFSQPRKLSLPVGAVSVLGLLFTQPSIFPYPYLLATRLAGTPLIGGALVTFLAIPDHALISVAVSYTILLGIGVHSTLTNDVLGRLARALRLPRRAWGVDPGGVRIRQRSLLAALLILLCFSGWQFFSGSFYPSGYYWGAAGNGVANIGAFTPTEPPTAMTQVYDWLLSQPGDFNIYWPGPAGAAYPWSAKATGSIAFQDAPKPTIFPRALPYLIASNLTAGIRDYLASLNVRYLIVQPFSQVAMRFDWGANNATSVNQILASIDGINVAQSVGDLTIYEVNGPWGSVYTSHYVTSYDGSDFRYAIAYGIFDSIGTRITITPPKAQPNQLCFDNSTCSISIMSPATLAANSSLSAKIETLQGAPVEWSDAVLDSGYYALLPSPSSLWSVTNWGPQNASVGITNSTLRWTFNSGNTYLTLSYNGTVTNGRPGGIAVSPDQVVTTRVEFWYRTSNAFDGTLRIVVPQLDRSGEVIQESVSQQLPPSASWALATFSMTLPFNTAFFTARIAASASSGIAEIKDVSISDVVNQRDGSAPFGSTWPVSNPANITLPAGNAFLQFKGNGSIAIGGRSIDLLSPDQFSWYLLSLPSQTTIQLSRDLRIGSTVLIENPMISPLLATNSAAGGDSHIELSVPDNVVYARPFARGYALMSISNSFAPSATIDGLNMFEGVSPGNYSISIPMLTPDVVAYLATIGLIAGIIIGEYFDSLKTLLERHGFLRFVKVIRQKILPR